MASSLDTLNDTFGIAGALAFDEPHPGMPRARITTAACTAELYLHGAHITAWQPAGAQPVLYLSPRSAFTAGAFATAKAVRGGIPVVFPWFADRTPQIMGNMPDGNTPGAEPKGPAHGFARTQPWQMTFAALAGDDLRIVLTLGANDISRSFGFDHFRLAYEVTLGRMLRARLIVVNESSVPLVFEEALHTYYAVSDIEHVSVRGLEGLDYLDKTDGFQRKRDTAPAVLFTQQTDRPYLDASGDVTLEDSGPPQRAITVSKANSQTTVVWNPWADLSAQLGDLGEGAYRRFCCVEAANAGAARITLAPGAAHAMDMVVSEGVRK